MFSGDYGFFDYKYDISGYSGQDFGGPAQTLYLGLSALLLILLLTALRGASRQWIRRVIGFTGIFLTLLYLGKTAWESYHDIQRFGAFNFYLLPLDTCSIVMPAALLAGFGRGRVRQAAESWLATGSVVGGVATMVRLNAFYYYPFFSFGALYSMLWHLLMVFLGLLVLVTRLRSAGDPSLPEAERGVGLSTLKGGFCFHLLFSLVVIPVDFLFDFDFMLYRNLGGVPFFEDLAARLTAAGLTFLNPLLMLLLYLLAFALILFLARAAALIVRSIRTRLLKRRTT
ncbi:MAG: hypothetical protein IKQ04_06540 [Oscillospiraceae bacterium]|nr:hypothetical protein [Oscillospiraceae bacterium]